MKYLAQVLLSLMLLQSTAATGGEGKTSSGGIFIDAEGRRCRAKTVDDDGTITAMVCAGSGERRKLRAEVIDNGDVPWPAGGDEEFKVGNAIYFREEVGGNSLIDDVKCYHIQKTDEPTRTVEPICSGDGVTFDEYDSETGTDHVTSIQLTGFEVGEWQWYATNEAGDASVDLTKDEANGGPHTFEVKALPSGLSRTSASTSTTEVVEEAEWTQGGQIQGATGRIYYHSNGEDYACTGTAMKDRKSGRSLIITAAHCVWDDIDELWGSEVIFIPNRDAIQTDLSSGDIKRQCEEDICGCWHISAGVTLAKWKDEEWPHRLAWDYGIWIVADEGKHEGPSCGSEALDEAVDVMEFVVDVDLENVHLHSLGYSLEHNPDFRYCADVVGFEYPEDYYLGKSNYETYHMPDCSLTGGSSGGPWCMDMDGSGNCKIVSINSWSYTDIPGNGGPIIDESEARCLVNAARTLDYEEIAAQPAGEQGVFVTCHDRPCIDPDEETEYRRLRGVPSGRKLCEN